MRNGFYLSTYFYIDKIAYLNEIELRHDMNMSLWKYDDSNITLVKYWELERFSGNKQHRYPFFDVDHAKSVINKLLRELNLSLSDMLEVWGTPELQTRDDYHSLEEYPDICYHSITHLFSSLLSDTDIFYEESILSIAVDGAPDNVVDQIIDDKYFYSRCYSKEGSIMDIVPAYSPGIHWGYVREYYKMREGSLMALGSASESQLIGYNMKDRYVNNKVGIKTIIDDITELIQFVENLSIEDEGKLFNFFDSRFSIRENKISMVMKVIHEKSIKIMEYNIESAIEKYNIVPKETYLCLSGGYALNCIANSYLMKKYCFKGFLSTPCVNDSGLSMGIALYAFYKSTNFKKINFRLKNSFYGQDILESDVNDFLVKYNDYIDEVNEFDAFRATKDISDHPLVWMQSKAEIGPRSLGHRSLIGDPTNSSTTEIVNTLKQREWWRPVAPIILDEYVSEWFEDSYSSPYMLHTFKIRPEKEKDVPSIIHLDKSARIQTISRQDNYLLYDLIKEFHKQKGVPILCNTSLNDKGEPIVNTLDEMINFALRKKIKVIYINGLRVKLKNHAEYREDNLLKREIDFPNHISEREKEYFKTLVNPHDIEKDVLTVYTRNPKLYKKLDIRKKSDVKILEGLLKLRFNKYHTY